MKKILFLLLCIPMVCLGQEISTDKIEKIKNTIKTEYDSLEKEVFIESKIIPGKISINRFIRPYYQGNTYVNFTINSNDNYFGLDKKGGVITFETGEELKLHETLNTTITDNGYNFSISIKIIGQKLWEWFSTRKIKKYRLYKYEVILSKEQSEDFLIAFKIIKDMKHSVVP